MARLALSLALLCAAACSAAGADPIDVGGSDDAAGVGVGGALAESGVGGGRAGGGGNPGSASTGGSLGSGGGRVDAGAGGAGAKGGAAGSGGAVGSGGAAGSGGAVGSGGSTGSGGVPGTWTNVAPTGACAKGFWTAQVHPGRPSDVYVFCSGLGILKSVDFGQTFKGPINTGAGGPSLDGGATIRIARSSPAEAPTIYTNNLYGSTLGIHRSSDGGVSWTKLAGLPVSEDAAWPEVDPYDSKHVLVTAHEAAWAAETTDGGGSWRSIPLDGGMMGGGSAAFYFVDTGAAATTRTTWLWFSDWNGGKGAWRTEDGGSHWMKVESFEKPHGGFEVTQPGGGVIFAGGAYGSKGWGTYRSADYGRTWTYVTATTGRNGVYLASSKAVYSWDGALTGAGVHLFVAQLPATPAWSTMAVPGLNSDAQYAVSTNDGRHNIIVSVNGPDGIWRYVEP